MNTRTNIRLKYLFSKRIGGAWGNEPDADNSTVCIRAADFDTDSMTHSKTDLTKRSFEADEIEKKQLLEGDLIIEKSGGGDNQPVGRVVRFNLNETALCSNFLELLRPNQDLVQCSYLSYLLYSLWNRRIVTASIKQTTGLQNLDISDYFDNIVELPALIEQGKIVKYLDTEIAFIDHLIKQKQKQLEILAEKHKSLITHAVTKGINTKAKLKNSGIDLLGEIPNNWNLKKVKYLTSKVGSGVTPKGGATVYQKTGVPLLRSQNIRFEGLDLEDVAFITEETHESMAGSKVYAGDVLVNITGASIGRCYFYSGEYGEANVNQHVCILRPNEEILTEYLYLLLSSNIGQSQVELHQVGGGREGLTFESLKSFVFPLPNIPEQKEILLHVKELNDEIHLLEESTKRSINLLKERRSALITGAVTGQIQIQ